MTEPVTSSPVRWHARRTGERAVLTAVIDHPWHIYATSQPHPVGAADAFEPGAVPMLRAGPLPTTVTAVPPDAVEVVAAPSPEAVYDPGFGADVLVHHGTVELTLRTTAAQLSVRYQACDGAVCLPPATVFVEINSED